MYLHLNELFETMHLFCTYVFLHVITSASNFCNLFTITLLIHPLHFNPHLNLPIPPNLSLTLPVSPTHIERPPNIKWDLALCLMQTLLNPIKKPHHPLLKK